MCAPKPGRGGDTSPSGAPTFDIVGNYLLRSSLETIRNHWKWYPEIISENWANTERNWLIEKRLLKCCSYLTILRMLTKMTMLSVRGGLWWGVDWHHTGGDTKLTFLKSQTRKWNHWDETIDDWKCYVQLCNCACGDDAVLFVPRSGIKASDGRLAY